jgi:hypothetical protein
MDAKEHFLSRFGKKPSGKSTITMEAAMADFEEKVREQMAYAQRLVDGDEDAWEKFMTRTERKWFRFIGNELFSKLGHNPIEIGGITEFGPIFKQDEYRGFDYDALSDFYKHALYMIERDEDIKSEIFRHFKKRKEDTAKPRAKRGDKKESVIALPAPNGPLPEIASDLEDDFPDFPEN